MTPADPAPAGPAATGPPPDHPRAELYLRLRAEAELRRALALPRYDPPGEGGLPDPLRRTASLARPAGTAITSAAKQLLPLGRRAAGALQPLADNAARTVQPFASRAEQAFQPLADDAVRALQPVAERTGRVVEPLAGQVIRTVLPLADEAARRLHPLAWQAAGRLQTLRYSGSQAVLRWRWRAHRATATLRRAGADDVPERLELSAEEGVQRLRTVAHALAQVGAIDRGTADSIMAGLETALAVRSRIDAHRFLLRDLMRARRHRRPASAPAGPYLAAPVGVTVPGGPDSGLAEIRLFTLVIAPDRAVLTTAGRLRQPPGGRPYEHPWPPFHDSGSPSATDDRGNRYQLDEAGGSTDGEGNWSCILSISPVPHAGIRWLELTMSPGSPPIRVDVAGHGADHGAAAGPVGATSPAERLVDVVAENLLHTAAAYGDSGAVWLDLSETADIVTALDAVGALAPARGAVGRLVTLAGRLGAEIPPALTAAAQPAGLPAAWENTLENRDRQDGPSGVAAAAAVLPELDGTRFVLAGLRSNAAGAELQALAWGWRPVPHFRFFEDAAHQWSWSARDDKGRWHIATEGSCSSDDHHADLELHLIPALHPDATSLEVTLACPSGRVSVTVPLNWWEAE
jgi:hypothetical protein